MDAAYQNEDYDARLWLRELMMSAQTNTTPFPQFLVILCSFILVLVPVAIDQVYIKLDMTDKEQPKTYWIYNGLLMIFNFTFYTVNLIFFWIAFIDSHRRNYIMKKLSQSLEFNFHTKDYISVRQPTINFLDTQTISSWLEARKLNLELGIRFQTRVQMYMTSYIVIDLILLALLIAEQSGLIDGNILS